jgi:hypothetical protein
MPETEQRNINPAALPDFHMSSGDNVLFCPLPSVRVRSRGFPQMGGSYLLKYNGGNSGIKISVLYWRRSLIRVSVIRGSTLLPYLFQMFSHFSQIHWLLPEMSQEGLLYLQLPSMKLSLTCTIQRHATHTHGDKTPKYKQNTFHIFSYMLNTNIIVIFECSDKASFQAIN